MCSSMEDLKETEELMERKNEVKIRKKNSAGGETQG